ncbi:MAG: hypothetical protein HQK98_02625 [Nitrospirae bacterium]|nr:hypothetical protein [Nitrospirota bacterium]
MIAIPRVLRERLGEDGVDALLTVFGDVSLSTRTDLATKSDVKDMATKSDIKDMATKSDLKDMATALRQEMATKDGVKAEIESAKSELLKWSFIFWVSQIGILIAALRFFVK